MEVVNTSDKDITVPVSHDHNCNFATVNRVHFRLTKSSPPKIPAQPVNIVPPVLPDMVRSNDISDKLKLDTAEDAPAISISQAPQKLSLYPSGQPPLSLQKCEPVKLSQTVNQDRDVILSNDNTQTPPNRVSSSPSEYSTLPPYPASANDSIYKTSFPNTHPKALHNVNSVYETLPEPAEPNNSFDTQPKDTPYLTPTGLPHFKN